MAKVTDPCGFHQPTTTLLIAYGNSLRRDDGAGLIMADRLLKVWKTPGRCIKAHQLLPEMAEDIAQEDVSVVLFVDTRDASGEKGDRIVQVRPIAIDEASPSLGHQLDPAALLTYVGLLYGRQPAGWLITAPGVDFGHGEGLSHIAQEAIDSAVDYLSREMGSPIENGNE